MVDIQIECMPDACIPVYQSAGASGADVSAYLTADIILKPGSRILVPTGIKFHIPDGYEMQVRSRSGLAVKYGIVCLNSPGTIDSDYRGEVRVILQNHGSEDFVIRNGDRIAQLVLAPVTRARFTEVPSLAKSTRGENGFGSTGI